ADELEGVVLVLTERRQARARHGELGAALDTPLEPDHRPVLRAALRRDDLRRDAVDVHDRAPCERVRAVTGTFDEERAVETVRAADAADRDELRLGRHVPRRTT